MPSCQENALISFSNEASTSSLIRSCHTCGGTLIAAASFLDEDKVVEFMDFTQSPRCVMEQKLREGASFHICSWPISLFR